MVRGKWVFFHLYFYIDDIIEAPDESDIGCNLIEYNVDMFAYAGDIAFISPCVNGLKYLIDNVIQRM